MVRRYQSECIRKVWHSQTFSLSYHFLLSKTLNFALSSLETNSLWNRTSWAMNHVSLITFVSIPLFRNADSFSWQRATNSSFWYWFQSEIAIANISFLHFVSQLTLRAVKFEQVQNNFPSSSSLNHVVSSQSRSWYSIWSIHWRCTRIKIWI